MPPSELADRDVRRAMRLSIADGILWAGMVGCGESYFLANGVRLGGSSLELGLLITLPLFLGAAGPIVALIALARARGRKPIVVAAALAQAGVLAALSLADREGSMNPRLLIGLATIYQMCGQTAGTAWQSWYGDLVPEQIRGRYFAQRNRLVHVAMCGSLIAAGLLLFQLEPGAAGDVAGGAGGAGYRVIFAIAATFRVASAVTLALAPESGFAGVPGARAALDSLRAPVNLPVRRLLGITFAVQFSVYLASPYFGPFMLERLRLSYPEYMVGTVAAVLFKFFSLPAWGRAIDHFGARSVYSLVIVLIAIIPLPWLWTGGIGWVVAAQALSGFAWGGHEVGFFSILLESTDRRLRPHIFASVSVLAGTAQLLASLAGGWLLAFAARDFRWVFAASMALRLAVAMVVPYVLPATSGAPPVGRRRILLRLIGISPSGGVAHRPVAVDEPRSAPPAITARTTSDSRGES